MPHLTLEYTANLEPGDLSGLCRELHSLLAVVGGIRLENCKSRWREVAGFQVGAGGAGQAFVHLSIRFLAGRSPEVRRQIGEQSLELVRQHFASTAKELDLQITVEAGEIPRAGYFKHPSGTLTPLPEGDG